MLLVHISIWVSFHCWAWRRLYSTFQFGGVMGLLLAREKWECAFLSSLPLHKRYQLEIMGLKEQVILNPWLTDERQLLWQILQFHSQLRRLGSVILSWTTEDILMCFGFFVFVLFFIWFRYSNKSAETNQVVLGKWEL